MSGSSGVSGSSVMSQAGTGTSTTTTTPILTPELSELTKQSTEYMTQLQNMLPLWGASTTKLKEGATPYGMQYPYVEGTPAVPGSSMGQLYVDPKTGIVYTGDQVRAEGGGFFAASGGTAPGNEGEILTQVEPFGSAGETPGTPAVPGYYDYSANPEFLYRPEDYENIYTSPNFLEEHPMQIAEADPLEQLAGTWVPELWNTPEAQQMALQYAQNAVDIAGQPLPNEGLADSELMRAYREAFERGIAPQIENQMGLAGLGRSSSLANALSLGWSQIAPQALENELARRQAAQQFESSMYGQMVPQLTALGTTDTERRLQAINQALQVGGTYRGLEQAGYQAAYNDLLRQQALAEQALFLPFGQVVPSTIGQTANTTGSWTSNQAGTQSQSGGGMFK